MTARVSPTARLLRVALVGAAALFLAGCTAATPTPAAGNVGSASATAGTGDVSRLVVGDCVSAVDGDLHAGFDTVPCSTPHDWEVYLDLDLGGAGGQSADVAGTDALVAAAEEGCGAAFDRFLQLSQAASAALGFTYLVAEPGSGSDPHTPMPVVRCLVGDMNGPVTGSLAGSALVSPAR
jgi:hypothetical protein